MNIVIIIPTYNEAENTKKMIPVLAAEFKKLAEHNIKVLYVDGNSPDGTAEIVRNFKKTYPFVDLLVEEKKAGLGAAYIQAFKYVMQNYKADAVMEMDADFQHSPAEISRFVTALEQGADYVVGSRFTKGGSIPKAWALRRKILSIGGNIFTKLVLGIFNINDFTSGFKATKVSGVLDKLDFASVRSKGFAYKVDLLYQVHKLGAKIVEVPISFGMRDDGDSKMERNNPIDTLRVVVSLRLSSNPAFFKFIAVGFAGLATDLLLFNLLRLTTVDSSTASALAGFIAMLVTFTLNNTWSFSDRAKSAISLLTTFPVYAFFSYIPILFRAWLVKSAIAYFSDTFMVANAAFALGVIIGLIWNFTVYSKIIWRKKHV